MTRGFKHGVAVAAAAAMIAGAIWMTSVDRIQASHFEGVMGTSLDIKISARSEAAGHEAEQAILQEIARESKILSGYDPQSEFSAWMRSSNTATHVSPELAEVLAAFDDWRMRTSGALNPGVEVLSRAWNRAAHDDRVPTRAELRVAVADVGQRHWTVDRGASIATHTSEVPLVLNSFTKSYIIDRAARRALSVPGVRGVMVNSGGDVVIRGAWAQTVGIADPIANADNAPSLTTLSIRDAVVATSGGGKRGFDIAGHHYSHVLDPRTGEATGHVLSATVVSSKAIDAGALATAFCVLTPVESAALARSVPGIEYSLVLAGGQRLESPNWHTLEVQPRSRRSMPSAVPTLYAAEQAAWNPGWQLTISLELPRMMGMAKRPYVAVWIEDKDRFPVRTVALWYDGKRRFLPELRAWNRSDRIRGMAEGTQIVDAVTSPTRQAGKYTLQWDGKDNAGKPVTAGTYTVCIEVSREHGSYQIVRQEMEFSGTQKHIAVPGGSELSGANLDYQPASGR